MIDCLTGSTKIELAAVREMHVPESHQRLPHSSRVIDLLTGKEREREREAGTYSQYFFKEASSTGMIGLLFINMKTRI